MLQNGMVQPLLRDQNAYFNIFREVIVLVKQPLIKPGIQKFSWLTIDCCATSQRPIFRSRQDDTL